jgi:hypothetical protein
VQTAVKFAENAGPSLQDELRKTDEVAKPVDAANKEAVRSLMDFLKYLNTIISKRF